MIKIFGGISEIAYKQFIFPGGEISIRLDVNHIFDGDDITIVANIQSATEVLELLMVTDAIKREAANSIIDLKLPYVPYARQDRVSVSGEALSIKVMADLINSQKYTNVTIWDPHSDVTSALINNLTIVEQHRIAYMAPIIWANTILVAPDAGAAKKIYKLANATGCEVITASKVRDPVTGNITGTGLDISLNPVKAVYDNTRFLIVDDICDGGRTFIELARVLKSNINLPIDLFVTHGIFSKGTKVFDGLIDNIYTANPWFEDSRIKQVIF